MKITVRQLAGSGNDATRALLSGGPVPLFSPAPAPAQARQDRAAQDEPRALEKAQADARAAAQAPAAQILDNGTVAARIAAAAPLAAVDAFLAPFGPRPDLGETTRRELFGSLLLELANQQNASLFELARRFGLPAHITGSAGLGKFFKKAKDAFTKAAPQIFREQVQNKVGEFVGGLGQSVLNLSNNVPLLGKFFLKPLGFTAQAELLRQIGNVLKGGSISDFDEKALAKEAASTFKEAGQALATAAPFFPPPWNVAAGALAGLSIAAGKILDGAIAEREAARAAEKYEAAQKARLARAQAVVDDGLRYGKAAADYAIAGQPEPAEPAGLADDEEQSWFIQAARYAFAARARQYGVNVRAQDAPTITA